MKILTILLLTISINNAHAQTPLGEEFTYQGELNDFNGNPHNGIFDFKFVAYDALTDGTGNNLGQFIAQDVQVSNGIFTTVIDYSILGDQPFLGDKVWLEISVRIGTSTGGYIQLLPRQQVTATPYATHAQFVGANAIGSPEIQNGSIQAADINPVQVQKRVSDACIAGQFIKSINQDGTVVCAADDTGLTTVTTTEIVDGTIQAVDVDSTQVQRRVSTACAAGEFIQSVNQDGTAVCVAETTGITSVTSAEIVDGTITAADIGANAVGTAEIDNTQVQQRITTVCSGGRVVKSINASGVASCIFPTPSDNSVNSAKVTDGSIVAVDVDSTQIQQRINGSCIFPEYLTSVSQTGDVVCARMPIGAPTVLDSAGIIAPSTSIAIGRDGNPVISYYNRTNSDLRVVKCTNPSCSTFNTPVILDSPVVNFGDEGRYTNIVIGADDNPVISYLDHITFSLKLVKCGNPSCSFNNTVVTLDSSTNDLGRYASLAIGADDFPIISYWDLINTDLKIVKCQNQDCSIKDPPRTLDSSTGTVGRYTSIAIGKDDLPIISYSDEFTNDLKIVRCLTQSCSINFAPIILDSVGDVGLYTSIAIGNDRFPIISYYDSTNKDLKIVHCLNQSCSSFDTPLTLDSVGDVGKYTSIAIGTDDNPIISYYDVTNKDLKIVHCLNQRCSSFDTPRTLDSAGFVGRFTSIARGIHGNPIISYFDGRNNDLKVYSCGDAACSR